MAPTVDVKLEEGSKLDWLVGHLLELEKANGVPKSKVSCTHFFKHLICLKVITGAI